MCPAELDKDVFGSWLCHQEQTVFIRPDSYFDSPLARWLQTVTGVLYSVDTSTYGRVSCDDGPEFPLPRWAVLFVQLVEHSAASAALTGADAFALLARVEWVMSRHTTPTQRMV